ncbi:MAG: Uracil-DNA glycosylase, partial [Roseomonas sp.]|nr:Uracil-DNA glycosylase [Roseomonas sp.]
MTPAPPEHADASPDATALLAALRLQLDWGIDEALADHPIDRLAAPPPTLPQHAPAALPHPAAPYPAQQAAQHQAAIS